MNLFPAKKIPGLRWYIASGLCLATALNYLDRQTLALLAPTLERELGLTTLQYSRITAAFLASYAVMYAVSGRLIDRLGARLGLAIFASAWSVANALHALAHTARQFAACRFLLGAAEPANFPAAVRAVAEWFPVRERALAIGIFNSGSAIGSGLAAPLVAWITLHFGWRYSFIAGGTLGGIWVLGWSLGYRQPRFHPAVSAEELSLIEEGGGPAAAANAPRPSIRAILSRREAWGCILPRMLTDQLSWFFIFWIPLFLQKERGFNLADIGRYYWIPYLASTVGNVAGGAIPRGLIGRGWSIDRARKTTMLAATVLIPLSFFAITRVPNPAWALGLITVAMCSHGVWGNITLPAEVFPATCVGAVTGFGGALGSGIGTISQLIIGRTVVADSFTPVFLAYAAIPVVAFALVLILIKNLGVVRAI